MQKLLLAAGISLAMVSIILYVSGCTGPDHTQLDLLTEAGKPSAGSILKDLGTAPATVFVSEAMRPYLSVGLGFCVLGVFAVVFGGRIAGVIFFISGVMVTFLGVGMMMYPWVTLIAFLAIGVSLVAGLWSWRNERKLTATLHELEERKEVESILVDSIQTSEGGKEVKTHIKERGTAIAQKVRKIVDPIKARMAT